MEPCEEFPTEGTEEPIYNSSDSEGNSSSDEDLDVDVNEEETSKDEKDRGVPNYLNKDFSAHQIQEKWESKFPFAIYSTKERGWLCKVCAEYSERTEQRKAVSVELNEHPTRTFLGHENSKKHANALKQQREVRKILTKGTIYKQMINGEKHQTVSTRERNKRVIKEFLKTAYVAKKKWAVREHFPDTIDFLRELPDEDSEKHFQEANCRVTYASKKSADEFIKCLSDYLEEGFKNRLLAASHSSLMTDETTDISDRAE